MPEPKPSWADWSDRADALGLWLRSGELVGPCPSCGGTDRFHIRRRDLDAVVGCRGCIDGKGSHRPFGAVIRAAFPERFDTIGSPSISRTPRTPKSPQPADTGPDPRAGNSRTSSTVACGRSVWRGGGRHAAGASRSKPWGPRNDALVHAGTTPPATPTHPRTADGASAHGRGSRTW